MFRSLGLLAICVGLFTLSACNTPGCLVQDKVVEVSSTFIANGLECQHLDAVQADVTKLVSQFGLCKTAQATLPQGPLADTVCPVVAGAVVGWVVTNGIPASWGCSATAVSNLAVSKLTDLCKKIPASEFHP